MIRRKGFTIIEIVLFVAISGFLIVGLMVGTAATVARQRYNDSVQDLAEFFRREYSAVINPENGRTSVVDNSVCDDSGSSAITNNDDGEGGVYKGRSNCLIYGRLITIGEADNDNDNSLYSYDIIGQELTDSQTLESLDLKSALINAKINVLARSDPTNPASATCSYQPVGQYKYSPQWLARAERTEDGERLKASILIVRSPATGAIHTLVYNDIIRVQKAINPPAACMSSTARDLINKDVIKSMTSADLNMCVGSDDIFAVNGQRRNVRLLRGGHNGSAVMIEDQDSEDNLCEE